MLIRSSRLLALLALALSFAACAAGATDIKPPGDQRVADLPPGAEGGTPDSTVDGPSTDQTSHDATVDGFEAIASIGQRALHDHAHRVVEIRLAHLGFDAGDPNVADVQWSNPFTKMCINRRLRRSKL